MRTGQHLFPFGPELRHARIAETARRIGQHEGLHPVRMGQSQTQARPSTHRLCHQGDAIDVEIIEQFL
jgi:hypothetical protein